MAGELESSRCALLDLKQRARCAAGLQKRVLALALQFNGRAVVTAERVRAPIAPCSDVFVRGALGESVGCASRAEAGFANLACDASGGEGGGHPGKEVLAGFAARPDEAVGDGREQRRVLCARQDAALAVDPAEEHVKDCSRVKVRLPNHTGSSPSRSYAPGMLLNLGGATRTCCGYRARALLLWRLASL